MMSVRALARSLVLALLVGPVGCASRGRAPDAVPVSASPRAVWQLTYLKADSGRVDALARFIEANWFAMDARARSAGDLEGYLLLRGTPADPSWDLVEITIFRDSAQHARADSLYRTVYRPTHRVVPIDGRTLRELGRIVGSVRTVPVSGRF